MEQEVGAQEVVAFCVFLMYIICVAVKHELVLLDIAVFIVGKCLIMPKNILLIKTFKGTLDKYNIYIFISNSI